MSGFLHVILTFPTALFTILMGVVMLYWLMVIMGALHIDMFSGHQGDGAGEGAAEGAGEGAAEGAAHGGHDFGDAGGGHDLGDAGGGHDVGDAGGGHDVGDGAAEAHGHDVGDGHGHDAGDGGDGGDGHDGHDGGDSDGIRHGGGFAALLSALGLRSAPLTVVISLIVFYSWIALIVGMNAGGPQLARVVPLWALNTLLVVLAMIIAIALASFTSRPMGRFFIPHQAPRRASLVGKRCTVMTGHVDGDFGQAEVADGGAGLLVQVRCDRPSELSRGGQAMIVAYDAKREAFLIEPVWGGADKDGRGKAA
jgi:hypothetical protein